MNELTVGQFIMMAIPIIIFFSIGAAIVETWNENRMHKKGYYYRKGGWIKL